MNKTLKRNNITASRKTQKKSKKNKSKHPTCMSTIEINSQMETGNILVKNITLGSKKTIIELGINDDKFTKPYKGKRYQYWFYFQVKNAKDTQCQFIISKLRNYYKDWDKSNICFSYDNIHWQRIASSYNDKVKQISWGIRPKSDNLWFAYYVPYTFSRLKNTLKSIKTNKSLVKSEIIGYSYNKNPLYMLTYGKGGRNVWMVARQHPGETIASWITEGILTNIHKYKSLLKNNIIRIIPCVNPDGVIEGQWYTNRQGINLNRDWGDNKSKETKIIDKIIKQRRTDKDIFIDIHGDEGNKKHFVTYAYTNSKSRELHKKFNKEITKLDKRFKQKDAYSSLPKSKKTDHTTFDGVYDGITIEGSMQHSIKKHKTLQDEPLEIGESILKVLIFLTKF